jgi:nitrate reductase beta subunit
MTAFDQMVEKFQLSDTNEAAPDEKSGRINLLNWDGKSTSGLVPGANGIGNGSAAKATGPTVNGAGGTGVNGSGVNGNDAAGDELADTAGTAKGGRP